jgi:urease accessory protein
MLNIKNKTAAGLILAALSAPAFAHTGAGAVHGFAAGFAHPLEGADHLLAMFAVGLWAAALGGRALWLLPLSFVSVMGLGAALAFAGLALPHAEWLVAASVLAFGLALWRDFRAAAGWAGALTGGFALFHGYVHAAELAAGANAASYAAGFLLATAGLHGLGLAAGLAGRGFGALRRGFGLVCAGVGAYLLSPI